MSPPSEELKTKVVLVPCVHQPCLGSGDPFLQKEMTLLSYFCFVCVFLYVAEGTGRRHARRLLTGGQSTTLWSGSPFHHSRAQTLVLKLDVNYPHLLSHLTVLPFCSMLFVCSRQGLIICLSIYIISMAWNSEFCLLPFPMFWY